MSVKFWHISESDIFELPEREHGQFHSADTYVVRWQYKVSLTGRDLKGRPSKHVAVGRERWAYFFWHGADSTTTEQGLSALMTVELDEEKGPQIRVEQGQESAAFLNLWNSKMVIHKGRRGGSKANNERLYFVKGECPEEACAVQVNLEASSLRSRGCLVLVGSSKATAWLGKGLPEHKKAVLKSLQSQWPELQSLPFSEEIEGHESEGFKQSLGLKPSGFDYHANLSVTASSVRLYHITSVSGEFHVNEIVSPYLNEAVPNVMSFNQSDLYQAEQPGKLLKTDRNIAILSLVYKLKLPHHAEGLVNPKVRAQKNRN
jgi:supervillin